MSDCTVTTTTGTPAGAAPSGAAGPVRPSLVAHCAYASCWWGALSGAAPHVLHHAGPLAGSAVIAGAGGQLVFGVLGLVATVPMLWRLRRRKHSWRAPAVALAAYIALFMVSTLVVGPALGLASEGQPPAATEPAGADHSDHVAGTRS